MEILLKVTILCLDSIRGKQNTSLWRTVDFITQDGILHLKSPIDQFGLEISWSYLQVEEAEGDVLDNLFCDIFWIEFRSELELQRRFFFHILQYHNWEIVQSEEKKNL